MRPETSVLLTLEPMSAILARVAYRLIQLDYRRDRDRYFDAPAGLMYLAMDLKRDGFTALSTWVSSYSYHSLKGVSAAAYKQRVVRRARWARLNKECGKPWARVPAK